MRRGGGATRIRGAGYVRTRPGGADGPEADPTAARAPAPHQKGPITHAVEHRRRSSERPRPAPRIPSRPLAGRRRRPRLHPAQLHALRRATRRSWPARPSARRAVWGNLTALCSRSAHARRLDVDAATPSTITSHAPGYIDRDDELIVGLQTDAPLKRAIMPNGGWRMVEDGLEAYGYEPDDARARDLHQVPQDPQRRRVRRLHARDPAPPARPHIITGLPDAYGRGRIIGDYRRVALYGVDRLIERQARRARRAGRARSAPRTSSATARSSPSRSARWASSGRWPPATASTSRGRRRPRARPCSGSTSPTWPRSRSRTAPRCRWAARRRSSTSTSQRDLADGAARPRTRRRS